MALVKEALPEMLMSILFRRDMGLTEAMKKGTYEALYAIHKDNKGNYLTPVEVPCYEYPMSEMTDELKAYYYNLLPLQGLAEIIGENIENFSATNILYKDISYNAAMQSKMAGNGKTNTVDVKLQNDKAYGIDVSALSSVFFEIDSCVNAAFEK